MCTKKEELRDIICRDQEINMRGQVAMAYVLEIITEKEQGEILEMIEDNSNQEYRFYGKKHNQ